MDDFWTEHIETQAITPEGWRIFLRVHRSEESYWNDSSGIESPFLTHHQGRKTYVLAKPCTLQPRLTLTVALHAEPRGEEIGQVIGSEWEGMDTVDLGNAQAWYYPDDGVLVLWECYLYEHVRQSSRPAEDTRHVAVWQAFEATLVRWFNPRLIITPAWEPVYLQEDWQAFLNDIGYQIDGNTALKEGRT